MQDSLLARVGEAVWGWPMMALFLGTGIWYMLRLRGLPLRRLGQALRAIFRGGESADGISPYAALCTALAATIGTGNIVGVATALAAGGPGALLWMMAAALFGMATQYAEGYLAVRYRRRQGGKWLGGPFCYIEQGLGWRWLAVTFAVVGAAVGLLGVGTVAQVNSITTAVEGFFDPLKRSVAMTAGGNAVTWAAVIAGGLTVLFSGMVLLGGADRISRVCSLVVPLMSAVYVLCSVLILVRCRAQIPAALRLIAVSAFSPRAAAGAAGGLTMRRILRMGIGRGVFTNEAGLGSTPIAAACSSNEDPVRQGLVTMTGTFLDTIVICSLTGLCLVVTGAWCVPGLAGFRITEQAWRAALPWPAGAVVVPAAGLSGLLCILHDHRLEFLWRAVPALPDGRLAAGAAPVPMVLSCRAVRRAAFVREGGVGTGRYPQCVHGPAESHGPAAALETGRRREQASCGKT